MSEAEHGASVTVRDGLRRLIAPNPGPMTFWGTNTWIVGEGDVAIVDPGPEISDHLAAILRATKGETVSHILVTHAHRDHSGLARRLSEATGAPVSGFGPAEAGRSETMRRLSGLGSVAGGEGVDQSFNPDLRIGEGDTVTGSGWTLKALHTPGHFAGHLAFRLEDDLISGDHVMSWSTSIVSPPDGDLGDFMATSRRLLSLGISRCFTGHGETIADPSARLAWLIAHRQKREESILAALGQTPRSIRDIVTEVYRDTPPSLHAAASRNVLAHLIDLEARNRVRANPEIGLSAMFTRT